MSNFSPLSWELQFTLKNQGKELSVVEKLLGNVQNRITKINAGFVHTQNLSNKAFSGLTQSAKNASNQIELLRNQIGKTNAAMKHASNFSNSLFRAPKNQKTGKNKLPNPITGEISTGPDAFAVLGKGAILALGSVVALAYGLKKVYDGLDEITEKAVGAFSERQSSLRAYTTLLGSATQAEKEYYKAASLSQKTELTNEQTLAVQNRLITAGFRGETLDRSLLNIADLVTLRPQNMRAASVNQLSELYSKVRGQGYVQEGLINRTASRFVGGNFIREEIAKQLGISKKEVAGALRDRKVSAEAFFNAFQTASLRQIGTQKVGQYAVGASGNLATLLSNQEEALQNLFRSVDPERIAGVEMYKRSIEDVTQAMSYSTETGKNLRYVLEEVSDAGTGLRAAKNEFLVGFLEGFGKSFRDTMKAFGFTSDNTKTSMMRLAEKMKEFGKYVGDYLGPIVANVIHGFETFGDVLSDLQGAWQEFSSYMSELVGYWKNVFKNFIGVFEGFFNKIHELGNILGGKRERWQVARRGTGEAGLTTGRRNRIYQEEKDRASYFQKFLDFSATHDLNLPGQKDIEENGGGGGKGRGKKHKEIERGVLFSFDYGNGGMPGSLDGGGKIGKKEIERGKLFGFSSSDMNHSSNFTPRAIQQTTPAHTKVNVGNLKVDIQVEGAQASPEQIARQISLEISQTFGRLARAPFPGAI